MNKSKKLILGLICFLTLVTMCTMASAQEWDDYYDAQDTGFALFGLSVAVCIIIFILLPLIIGILIAIWVYRDAEKRGSSGVLWLIIVLLTSIIGLIIWLVVRPPIGGEKKEPDRRCPGCGRAIPVDAKACPYCAKKFE